MSTPPLVTDDELIDDMEKRIDKNIQLMEMIPSLSKTVYDKKLDQKRAELNKVGVKIGDGWEIFKVGHVDMLFQKDTRKGTDKALDRYLETLVSRTMPDKLVSGNRKEVKDLCKRVWNGYISPYFDPDGTEMKWKGYIQIVPGHHDNSDISKRTKTSYTFDDSILTLANPKSDTVDPMKVEYKFEYYTLSGLVDTKITALHSTNSTVMLRQPLIQVYVNSMIPWLNERLANFKKNEVELNNYIKDHFEDGKYVLTIKIK